MKYKEPKKKIIKKLLPIINTWCEINPIIRNKYMLLSVLYDSVLQEMDSSLKGRVKSS